jgi:hypothetical protein
MRKIVVGFCLLLPVFSQEKMDLGVVGQIKTEAFENSKVMDHLEYLTDWYGPRLTGSPEWHEAADWTIKRLSDYGLENPHLEKWGKFGRAWSVQKYSVELLEPRYSLLAAAPMAWSRGTNGPVAGELVLVEVSKAEFGHNKEYEADVDKFSQKYKGQLRGKIVLITKPIKDVLKPEENAQLKRYTDAELAKMAESPDPSAKPTFDPKNLVIPEDPDEARELFGHLPFPLIMKLYNQRQEIMSKLNAFLVSENVAGVLRDDGRAHDGMLFSEAAGAYQPNGQLAPPTFVVTAEHYNRLVRLLEKKAPVRVQVNLQVKAPDAAVDAYNIIAEIPGTTKKDEVVMVGAHFDSWHTGTGATDNGAGSAVMIEVVRILKALNLKMDRTVRIGLWSGEEQGILGSEAYVKEHFADPASMHTTAAWDNFAGYFNLDNGSGKIRGVYLQGNDAMRPLFEQWLHPFHDLGVGAISIRNTGGTDHLSFDAVGLPGFQFIQDPLDYGTVTHHSSMDVYDHAVPADLMQASAVIATCVYEAATRPEKLPRKATPKPLASE